MPSTGTVDVLYWGSAQGKPGHVALHITSSLITDEVQSAFEPQMRQGRNGLYISFYPEAKYRAYLHDIDAQCGYGGCAPDIRISLTHLDVAAILRKAREFVIERPAYAIFSAAPHVIDKVISRKNTQNCSLHIYYLLQAGGANLPSINPVPFNKQLIFFILAASCIGELNWYNREISRASGAVCSSETLVNSGAPLFAYHLAIQAGFSFNWLSYFLDSKANGSSIALGLIGAATVFYEIAIKKKDFARTSLIVIAAAMIFPAFYFAQHFLYERTLSPRDLYELLQETITDKNQILHRHEDTSFSISKTLTFNKIFYLAAGSLYAYIHTKHYLRETEALSIWNKHFITEFLVQAICTQYIHFNKEASLLAMLMGLPVIGQWTGANYGNSSGWIGHMDSASRNFLNDGSALMKIAVALVCIALVKQQLKRISTSRIEDEDTPQPISSRSKLGIIGVGAAAIVGVGFWAYKNPTSIRHAIDEVKRSFRH